MRIVRAQNAVRIASSVPVSVGFSNRKQTGPFVPSQFTFARWGRPSHAELRRAAGTLAETSETTPYLCVHPDEER
jgi:hypothetical protein